MQQIAPSPTQDLYWEMAEAELDAALSKELHLLVNERIDRADRLGLLIPRDGKGPGRERPRPAHRYGLEWPPG